MLKFDKLEYLNLTILGNCWPKVIQLKYLYEMFEVDPKVEKNAFLIWQIRGYLNLRNLGKPKVIQLKYVYVYHEVCVIQQVLS